jgi:hypothetical protein
MTALVGPALAVALQGHMGAEAVAVARDAIGAALRAAVAQGDGAVDRAAAQLGISGRTLRRWIDADAALVPSDVVLPRPGHRAPRWRLYVLGSAPTSWVATDGTGDGSMWLFGATAGGWTDRRPYLGHRSALRVHGSEQDALGTGWPGATETGD